jgi:hypothetical protein
MRILIRHRLIVSRSLAQTSARGTVKFLAASLLGASVLAAQAPPAQPGSATTHANQHQRSRSAAAHPSSTPVVAAPIAPPPSPNWPINNHPTPAMVKWDSQGLRIDASNSSLQQILADVTTATGAKVEGFGQDERVFGDFGPGQARDVLAQLLQGSGYNILMIGDQGQGVPRQVVLSSRHAGRTSQSVARPAQDDSEDDSLDNQVDTQPQPPPAPQPGRPGFGPEAPGRTPQQVMQEMQLRQQQLLQQQQQMQQQQTQQPNAPPN